jgi:putative SOS response-associated peptidase YedK
MDPTLAAALSAVADRYNIAVRKPASVIVQGEAGPAALEAIWGLVPRWSPEPATKYTTVTARLERAARSRIFANAWQHRHCVVPMSGYYKWDRSVSPPVPNFIQSTRGDILLVAGLWETWEKGDVPLHTFTILTHPNDAIPAPLVPDGPVFLPQAQWRSWLAGAPRLSARVLSRLEQPMLEAYPVSRAVRDPDRDDYTLLEPASTSTSAEDPVFSLDDDLDGFDDVDDVDDES